MAREIAVTLYLLVFTVFFRICKLFSLENKVVFVVSFSENNKRIHDEMVRQDLSCRTVFLTTEKMFEVFSKRKNATTLMFEMKRPLHFVRSIFHLATSKIVFVDNYYGFLAKTEFKAGVECVQIWHANGAVKKFGFEDPSIQKRSDRAIIRFGQVYSRFTKVLIGSDSMGDIYKKAFRTTDEVLVKTGIPRTDVFFDTEKRDALKKKFFEQYPEFQGKKILLYAPTYRESDLSRFNMLLDVKMLMNSLSEDYVLLVKLHPAISDRFDLSGLDDRIMDVSHHHNLNFLLFAADLLITDYSSIPFEFSLLKRPIIFFFPDFEAYKKERGVWKEFESDLPGPVASTTEQVYEMIHDETYDLNKVEEFALKWNEYSRGDSSKNVVEMMKHSIM